MQRLRTASQLVFLLFAAPAFVRSVESPAAACAACHVEAKTQPATSMAHALEPVEECRILSSHPVLIFKGGKYSYRIERHGDQSSYKVSDGTGSLTLPIRWAMGSSSAIGQTYVLEDKGQLYESTVSYFAELNGLDITIGASNSAPESLLDAAGRQIGRDDAVRCFGCHATNATANRELTIDKMTPGVQCERCHGPADQHLAAVTRGDYQSGTMKALGKLSTEQLSNFCGQCHRTWEEIVLQGSLNINNIRFQPYRLAGSKCYDADDSRISCLACHDPHHEVDTRTVDYDAKCLACHGTALLGSRPGSSPKVNSCSVAASRCASCHMPKLDLPGAHHKFTDHRIRIVKANEPYPG